MCIIIDACCLAAVFNTGDRSHPQYKPVADWILEGNGLMVYGGTQYTRDLCRAKKYISIVNQLKKAGKVINDPKNDNQIDKLSNEIKRKIRDHDFDDPHIIAIVVITKCRLI